MSERIFLITGDRNWNCEPIVENILYGMISKHGNTFTIIHGDCPTGVDHCFKLACERIGVDQILVPANWNGITRPEANVRHKDGRGTAINAGPRRNGLMIRVAQGLGGTLGCIALHRRLISSKGTRDMVQQCLRASIPVWLIDNKEGQSRRLKSIADVTVPS